MNNINEDNCYKIYAHINKLNGKMYIGQTKQELEQRWRNGEGYKKSPRFYNAIQKYGWDNFEHVVFATGLSLDLANLLEEFFIRKYDTTNDEIGYNIAFGGDNKIIPQESIQKMLQVKKANRHNYDFLKEVHQYDMDGNYLNTYDSYREASRQTNVGRAGIAKCCKGDAKSAGGFLWSNDKVDNIKYDSMKQQQVDRFTKDAVYVDSFLTAKVAEKELGISSSAIYACCNGRLKSVCGFIWRFHKDADEVQRYKNDAHRGIKQIELGTFNVINVFDMISTASSITGISASSISQCCLKNLKTAGGYIWRYVDDESEIDPSIYKPKTTGKYVKQIDKNTNEIICIFRSLTEASNATNTAHCNISNCLAGRKKSAGGFKWEYSNEEEYLNFHSLTNQKYN